MGSDLSVEHGPARAVNGVTRRLADTAPAREQLGFEAEVDLEEGLTRWSSGGAPSAPAPRQSPRASAGGLMESRSPARTSAATRSRRRRGDRLRVGRPGPPGRARSRRRSPPASAPPTAVAVDHCTTALHLALYVVGRRPRRRGHRARRCRSSPRPTPSGSTAARRCSPTSTRHRQYRPATVERGDHRAHQGVHAGPPGRASRPTWTR